MTFSMTISAHLLHFPMFSTPLPGKTLSGEMHLSFFICCSHVKVTKVVG